MSNPVIQVYGTVWCPDCHRARQVLAKNNVAYVFHDIGEDKEALAYVERANRGMRSVPVIVFPDASLLVEPSNSELEKKLHELAG